MTNIFKPPQPQQLQEDPEVKRLREQEQALAERDRTKALQGQLSAETSRRSNLGIASLFSSGGSRRLTSLLGSG